MLAGVAGVLVLGLAAVAAVVALGLAVGLPSPESPEQVAELRDACADGSMRACDDLYWVTPVGSEDEEYGSTCGGRTDPLDGDCEATLDRGRLRPAPSASVGQTAAPEPCATMHARG